MISKSNIFDGKSIVVFVLLSSHLFIFAISGILVQFVNISPSKNINEISLYEHSVKNIDDIMKYRHELIPLISKSKNKKEQTLIILKWVSNKVPKVGDFHGNGSWDIVENGIRGGGALCGGMADIFHDALISVGIPARRVVLTNNIFGDSNHTAVEVLIDNRWILFDPTFGIYISQNRRDLSAIEIRSIVRRYGSNNLTVNSIGKKLYPVNVNTYYINYFSLFDDVLVEYKRGGRFDRFIPIIGPYFSPHLKFQTMDGGPSNRHLFLYMWLYWSSSLIFPSIVLLYGFSALRLKSRPRPVVK